MAASIASIAPIASIASIVQIAGRYQHCLSARDLVFFPFCEQAGVQDPSSLIFFADSAKSASLTEKNQFFFFFFPAKLASHVAAVSDFCLTVFDYRLDRRRIHIKRTRCRVAFCVGRADNGEIARLKEYGSECCQSNHPPVSGCVCLTELALIKTTNRLQLWPRLAHCSQGRGLARMAVCVSPVCSLPEPQTQTALTKRPDVSFV